MKFESIKIKDNVRNSIKKTEKGENFKNAHNRQFATIGRRNFDDVFLGNSKTMLTNKKL